MKKLFSKIGHFFTGIPENVADAVKGAITEGVEHGEAEVLDLVAGVVEDVDVDQVSIAIKHQLRNAIEQADFSEPARLIQRQLIAALNKRAAELRK